MSLVCYTCGETEDTAFGRSKTKCRKCINARMRKWRGRNPEKGRVSRRQQRLRKRGMLPIEYARRFKEQNGCCAICSLPSKKRLHIDHCHKRNFVRGLLCHSCNVGLGFFLDRVENLESAIRYLRISQETF